MFTFEVGQWVQSRRLHTPLQVLAWYAIDGAENYTGRGYNVEVARQDGTVEWWYSRDLEPKDVHDTTL